MEDIRLLLNDQVVDLPEGVERLLRMQKPGTDVASLESRAAESSYSLGLPFTRANDRIFAHHRDPQTLDKFAPLQPYVARLYVNGHLFFRGVWQLLSIKGEYVGKLVSEEVDVFTAIGSKSLQELRFAPFAYRGRHGFDERLGLSMADTDVQFPFVAYGNFYQKGVEFNGQELEVPASARIGSAGLEIDDYLPSVSFVRTLRQIFADVGWQIRGEVLEQPDVQELCLPFTGTDVPWNWGELLRYEGRGVSFINSFASSSIITPYPWVLQCAEEAANPAARVRSLDVAGTSLLTNGTRLAYSVRLDGGYRVRTSLTVSALQGGAATLQLVRLKPGQLLLEGEVLLSVAVPGPGTYSLDTDTLSLNGVYLETGEIIVPQLDRPAGDAAGFLLTYSAQSFVVEPREAWPTTLDVAKLLPAMSQRDFIKGFVTAKNLRFTADPTTRVLTFHLRERYELPASLALDLSGVTNPEAGEYVPALPARRIVLGWADDEADALLQARKGFADYTYQPSRVPVGVEADEQQLRLPWAPVLSREYSYQPPGVPDPVTGIIVGGGPLVRVRLPCLATAEALATPLNEVSWSYGFAPRLLRYRGPAPAESQVLTFAFKAGGAYGLADFPEAWQFGGPGGLYEQHYAGLFEQLLRGHLLRIGAAISPGQYARLSPAVPVLVHGSLYRLGKVPSFVVGGEGETALELLRIVPVPVASGGGVPPASSGGVGIEFFWPTEWYREEWY